MCIRDRQIPDWAVNTIAADCGIKKENIKLNLALMGGSFGRRIHFDFAIESVKIAQQTDKPVQLLWERTDDTMFSPYRPANYHQLKASLDEKGNLVSWQHHVLGTPIAYMTEGPESKSAPEMEGADMVGAFRVGGAVCEDRRTICAQGRSGQGLATEHRSSGARCGGRTRTDRCRCGPADRTASP